MSSSSTPAASSTAPRRRASRRSARRSTENGKVIVTGCLGAEADIIRARHPKVLAITGPHQYEAVMGEVHKVVPAPHDPFVDLVPKEGLRLTPKHYAYLKISEGCNNTCSFCIIPDLRGKLASRRIDDVLGEAERLVDSGVKELLVISQDTSAYGIDLKYAGAAWQGREVATRFRDLAKELGTPRRLGAAALRLPLPARRRGDPADGGRASAALPRHPVPAFGAERAESDAAAGGAGADARTHSRLAQGVPRPCHPLDLHRRLPGRDRRRFRAHAAMAEGCPAQPRRLLQVRERRRCAGE